MRQNELKNVVDVAISKLTAHPKNPNKHPKDQIDRLAEILKYQGFRQPVVVSKRSGYVVAGHGRIEAAKKNKWDTVPVVYQDFDDDAQEYAHLTADNAIAAWAELQIDEIKLDAMTIEGMNPDMLGIKDLSLGEDKYADKDADAVPEVSQNECGVELGDIYQLGEHRLMCGDSTDFEAFKKLMANEIAELCFTSPPYADQREYGGDKELSTKHLATFMLVALDSVKYFAVNLGYSRKNGEVNPYWNDYIQTARDIGLKFLSWNVWDKGECGSIGNQTAMFGITHEWIFVFGQRAKDIIRTVKNKSAGERANHTGNRQADGSIKQSKERTVADFSQLKTVYACTAQKARDDINHPARFPVEFPEGYIYAMTKQSDGIYEPFCGSGSTLIACEKTNRKCFGMELDPHYCSVIIKRWEQFTNQKAKKLNG